MTPAEPSAAIVSPWFCRCGAPAFAIRPGSDAEYGEARDIFGEIDRRLPPVLIRRAVANVCLCIACMPRGTTP